MSLRNVFEEVKIFTKTNYMNNKIWFDQSNMGKYIGLKNTSRATFKLAKEDTVPWYKVYELGLRISEAFN